MAGLPVSSRTLLILGGVVAVVAVIELTPIAGWLSYAGYTAMLLVAPLALVGILLMGMWTGFKYVKNRDWRD